ncbi:hypothetical protein BH09CHL1_BH09CHL1_00950 [soil metagenome]
MTKDRETALLTLLEQSYLVRGVAIKPVVEYGDGGGVYRVARASEPDWILRVFAIDRPMERVRGDAAILKHLASQDVPCEQLVSAADGSGSVDLDDRGVIVTHFVKGVRPSRTINSIRRLGEVLGRVNAAPSVPADHRYLGRRAGAIPREDLDYGVAQLARVADRVPAEAREMFATLQMELKATNDCEKLPFGLIHSDCHLDNTIESADGRITLIDWVGAGQGPRLAPIGVLLYSLVVQSPGDVPANFERMSDSERHSAIDAFAEGYCRHHALTSPELDHLSDAIRVRPLVVAAREFSRGVEMDGPLDAPGWWTGYGEAEAIAVVVRDAFERHGRDQIHR